jgi:non-specific serine/threonine protein kinase
VAAELLEKFDHGVWFVELASLTAPDLIPQTILSAIGISEQPNKTPLEILKKYLHEKKVLIVLDNCEHLVEASTKVIDALLNAAPELKILASSREVLGVKGELLYPVPSLSLPDIKHLPVIEQFSQYEAVRLFVDRAALVSPHFEVNKENAPAIAQICSRLDGIPLALELAAARVKMLSVDQISKRLNDRFCLLTNGARTALPRQQTLRALIDWSYDLLTENERLLLRRLSVFVGGWTLGAAEEVCSGDGIESDQILDLMSQLVNKSLVAVEKSQVEPRFRILETVRQYAREKLFDTNEASQMCDKHLAYFVKLAEEAESYLLGIEQVKWLNQLDIEHNNLLATLEWSLKNPKDDIALRMVGALGQFWLVRNHFEEGKEWVRRAAALGNKNIARSKALYWGSMLARTQGDFQTAKYLSHENLKLCRTLEYDEGIAGALNVVGTMEYFENKFSSAQKVWEEALTIYRDLEDKHGIIRVLNNLGYIAHTHGNVEQAQSIYEECLIYCRELDDKWALSRVLLNLGHTVYAQKNHLRARELYEEDLSVTVELGDTEGIAYALISLANVLSEEGQHTRSAQIQGAVMSIEKEPELSMEPIEQADYEKTVSVLKGYMGGELYEKELETGKQLSVGQAIELALKET